MILDELTALNPQVRLANAHCVEVPVQLCPTYVEEKTYGLNWTRHEDTDALLPRCPGSKVIDASWIRLPYPTLVLFHAGEDGCVVIDQLPEEMVQKRQVAVSESGSGAYVNATTLGPWAYVVDGWRVYVVAKVQTRVFCLLLFEQFVGIDPGSPMRSDEQRILFGLIPSDVGTAHINLLLGNGPLDIRSTLVGDVDAGERLDYTNVGNGVAASLALLNCKNITQREVRPPRQLRRHAARTGGLPPFSYHVLDIRTSSGRKAGEGGIYEPLALHWTRGHFKDYREGSGLFGRARGLYWWSAHLTGQADRIVTKDYAIKDKA